MSSRKLAAAGNDRNLSITIEIHAILIGMATAAPSTTTIPALLTTDELAEKLGVTPWTVRKWRRDGTGPPYVELTASRQRPEVRYIESQVVAWLEERTRTPRSW